MFQIEGYAVVDAHYGDIGVVKQIVELPGHEVLSVMKGRKEILIPIGGAIIRKVDRKEKKILIHAPDGLIDSYLA